MAIRRVLIANRGEIAVRIIRACQTLGLETVAPVSEADRDSLAARMADRAVCIGPAMASGSYLNVGALTATARGAGADSLHPGYGFLAESAELADACERFGITFVNARAEHLRQMGNKLEARELVRNFGIPTLPGSKKVPAWSKLRRRPSRLASRCCSRWRRVAAGAASRW